MCNARSSHRGLLSAKMCSLIQLSVPYLGSANFQLVLIVRCFSEDATHYSSSQLRSPHL